MTETELQEIRARMEAATPGPWLADYGQPAVVTEGPARTDYPYVWAGFGSEREAPAPADLEFIAHAREDIPRLLAEIARLQAESGRSSGPSAERPAA